MSPARSSPPSDETVLRVSSKAIAWVGAIALAIYYLFGDMCFAHKAFCSASRFVGGGVSHMSRFFDFVVPGAWAWGDNSAVRAPGRGVENPAGG